MKTVIVILTSLLILTSAFADVSMTGYLAVAGSGKNVTRGCVQIVFDLSGFTGTIGNISYSNRTVVLTVQATNSEGQRIGAVPYSVSSGILNIMELR